MLLALEAVEMEVAGTEAVERAVVVPAAATEAADLAAAARVAVAMAGVVRASQRRGHRGSQRASSSVSFLSLWQTLTLLPPSP